jgi:predicted nucleic acid-binding Zn ribbon protein
MHAAGPGKEPDWYAVLGLGPGAHTGEIAAAVERMSRQASALANTAPRRSQELREITRAIKRDLLSGPEARQRYDLSRAGHGPSAPPSAAPPPAAPPPATAPPPTPPPAGAAESWTATAAAGAPVKAAEDWTATAAAGAPHAPSADRAMTAGGGLGARIMRFMQTGWTCPACGQGAMPNDRFCTKCGAEIRPPAAPAARAPAVLAPAGTCAACGNALITGQDFCTRCGERRP